MSQRKYNTSLYVFFTSCLYDCFPLESIYLLSLLMPEPERMPAQHCHQLCSQPCSPESLIGGCSVPLSYCQDSVCLVCYEKPGNPGRFPYRVREVLAGSPKLPVILCNILTFQLLKHKYFALFSQQTACINRLGCSHILHDRKAMWYGVKEMYASVFESVSHTDLLKDCYCEDKKMKIHLFHLIAGLAVSREARMGVWSPEEIPAWISAFCLPNETAKLYARGGNLPVRC